MSRRVPVTKPHTRGGSKQPSSRPIYTARTNKGPFLVPSVKRSGVSPSDSSQESLFVAAAGLDPRVQSLRTQPMVMDVRTGIAAENREQLATKLSRDGYSIKDAVLWYVDIELTLRSRASPVLVEVKRAEVALTEAFRDRLEKRRAACKRAGYGFTVMSEDAFTPSLTKNVRILRRYQRHAVAVATADRVSAEVRRQRCMSVEAIAANFNVSPADAYALVARGKLGADLASGVLCLQSLLRAPMPADLHLLDLGE